jgi:hypothetical protein
MPIPHGISSLSECNVYLLRNTPATVTAVFLKPRKLLRMCQEVRRDGGWCGMRRK